MDDADLAVRHEQRAEERAEHRAKKLRLSAKPAKSSASRCVECDEPIPTGRQLAVPGVELCIECQTFADRRAAR